MWGGTKVQKIFVKGPYKAYIWDSFFFHSLPYNTTYIMMSPTHTVDKNSNLKYHLHSYANQRYNCFPKNAPLPSHLMITCLMNPFTGDLRLGCGAFQYLANHERGSLMILQGGGGGGGSQLVSQFICQGPYQNRCQFKIGMGQIKILTWAGPNLNFSLGCADFKLGQPRLKF